MPIQNPSATDRTEGIASVTTRTPESSVGEAVLSAQGRQPLGIAVGPRSRAAGAARGRRGRRRRGRGRGAAVAAVAAAARRGGRSPPPPPPAPTAASSSTDLPAIVGVLGEAQADAAALAVDLDHADLDLVALVEDVLDGVDALAGRDVGDVQQAVGALGELDERAEGRRLDDLAGELVADLDLLGHRPDPLGQRVAELAVGRVDRGPGPRR